MITGKLKHNISDAVFWEQRTQSFLTLHGKRLEVNHVELTFHLSLINTTSALINSSFTNYQLGVGHNLWTEIESCLIM